MILTHINASFSFSYLMTKTLQITDHLCKLLLSSMHLHPRNLHETSLSVPIHVLNLIITQIHQCCNSSESSTEHNGNVPLFRQLLSLHRDKHKQRFACSFAWLQMCNVLFPFNNTTTNYSYLKSMNPFLKYKQLKKKKELSSVSL